jgi:hypothetical protein
MSALQEPSALTLQLLTWVEAKPRSYGEAMEAWRTSCPRMPIWEDAVSDGLIAFNGSAAMRDRNVVLTDRGRAALNGHAHPLAHKAG